MTDPFTGLPMDEVHDHNEARARANLGRRDRFELAVSDFSKRLGNANDRLYGRKASRWNRRSWRFVDRIAVRLYTFGER